MLSQMRNKNCRHQEFFSEKKYYLASSQETDLFVPNCCSRRVRGRVMASLSPAFCNPLKADRKRGYFWMGCFIYFTVWWVDLCWLPYPLPVSLLLPCSQQTRRESKMEKLMGPGKGKEIAYQWPLRANWTRGKLIHCQLKIEYDSKK